MELDDSTINVEENVNVENTPANTLALLLIERYSKSLHRLNGLREVCQVSTSLDSLLVNYNKVEEARKMVDSVRQMEQDFKKVMPEYEKSPRGYLRWLNRCFGKEWPLYLNISAKKEEQKQVYIPAKHLTEYASNLEAIGRTLDDITRSLAFALGFEKVNYLALREYFTPKARGANDKKFKNSILPEIRKLRNDGLSLKEWGAVAYIIRDSEAVTDKLTKKSFDSWCREFLALMRVPFTNNSVPRMITCKKKSWDGKFSKLVAALNYVANP